MVVLSDKEQMMCDVIMQVIDGTVAREAAAEKLGVSTRTIYRRCARYLFEGTPSFSHALKNRPARNRRPQYLRKMIVDLYEQKYVGYNFTHFYQKLSEVEMIDASSASVYRILTDAGHVSPRARKVKRKVKIHPSRERRKCFGELLQMDASKHDWFGIDSYVHLHAAIDDATSRVLGAYFAKEETLTGYYQVFSQILANHGIPEEFYTDKRSVFSSVKTRESSLAKDTSTQFRVAASKLGVSSIHLTSSPQAKGRIERLFNTFQDRLISELRSKDIATIEDANAYLPVFIADHNERYGLCLDGIESAFGPKMSQSDINIALSIIDTRTVSNGSVVSYKGQAYVPFSEKGRIDLAPKTQVIILKSLDDKLYLVCKKSMYPLIHLANRGFPTPEQIRDKTYIPPKDHPWKEESYKLLITKYRRAG
jgi:transposase